MQRGIAAARVDALNALKLPELSFNKACSISCSTTRRSISNERSLEKLDCKNNFSNKDLNPQMYRRCSTKTSDETLLVFPVSARVDALSSTGCPLSPMDA